MVLIRNCGIARVVVTYKCEKFFAVAAFVQFG